jgi:hypothetical protein
MTHNSAATTPTHSVMQEFTIHSPRRSPRLSSRSTQGSPRSIDIRRTLSGGVGNSHLSNSTWSKQRLLNSRKGTRASSKTKKETQSIITTSTSLGSDQSSDEEMTFEDSPSIQTKTIAPVTRSEILSYFEEQSDGYLCKLCQRVSSP